MPPDPQAVAAVAAMSRLGAWMREHNRAALAAASLTLVLAAVTWGLYYLAGYTLLILGDSIGKAMAQAGVDALGDASHLRAVYPPRFLIAGTIAVLVAVLGTHWHRATAFRDSLPFFVRGIFDLLILPATLLVDGLDTLRALTWLRKRDRPLACALLARLDAAGGRLALGTLAQDTPDRRQLLRVLQSLHVAEVVETRGGMEPKLLWRSREASERLWVRIDGAGPRRSISDGSER